MSGSTTNKGFIKPTVSGDQNIWGGLLNGDLDKIDSALGATLSLSVAGSSNVTLSSAQAINLAYNFTGALGASIEVIWPAVGGFYVIANNTSGAWSLVVITAAMGSTGISIPQGYAQIIYMDGTNAYAAGPPINLTTGAIDFAGTTINGGTFSGGTLVNGTLSGTTTIPGGGSIASAGAVLVGAGGGGGFSGAFTYNTVAIPGRTDALAHVSQIQFGDPAGADSRQFAFTNGGTASSAVPGIFTLLAATGVNQSPTDGTHGLVIGQFSAAGAWGVGSAGSCTFPFGPAGYSASLGIGGSSTSVVAMSQLHFGDSKGANCREFAFINGFSGDGIFSLFGAPAVNTNPVGGTGFELLRFNNLGAIRPVNILTTASAANAFLDGADGNNLLRSTSSISIKHKLDGLTIERAGPMFDALRPTWFNSKADADDPDRRFLGFIAEWTAEIDPALATFADGKPNNIDDRAVLALAITQIQALKAEIDALKAQMKAMSDGGSSDA